MEAWSHIHVRQVVRVSLCPFCVSKLSCIWSNEGFYPFLVFLLIFHLYLENLKNPEFTGPCFVGFVWNTYAAAILELWTLKEKLYFVFSQAMETTFLILIFFFTLIFIPTTHAVPFIVLHGNVLIHILFLFLFLFLVFLFLFF